MNLPQKSDCYLLVSIVPLLHAKNEKKLRSQFWENFFTKGQTKKWTNGQTNQHRWNYSSYPMKLAGLKTLMTNLWCFYCTFTKLVRKTMWDNGWLCVSNNLTVKTYYSNIMIVVARLCFLKYYTLFNLSSRYKCRIY